MPDAWVPDDAWVPVEAVALFIERPEVAALFADAVAQGMHSPFALDCAYWGRQYQEKLHELLSDSPV